MNKKGTFIAVIFGVILALMFIGSIISSICLMKSINKEQAQVKKEHDFLKIPEYTDNNSYWFVVVKSKNKADVQYNIFVKQNHSWFSVEELKNEFSEDIFLYHFMRIDKETYEHN